jgi:hypothetical protein
MASLLVETTGTMTLLSPEDSVRILQEAVSAHVLIHLKPARNRRSPGVYATLTAMDESALTARLEPDEPKEHALHKADSVKTAFTLRGKRYAFAAPCHCPSPEQAAELILLELPETIALLQRRSSKRYRFQPTIRVSLWMDGRSDERSSGTVLNLSTDGIACLLPKREAHHVEPGANVGLSFALRDGAQPVQLKGIVTNVTPVDSPLFVVLGIQFIFEAGKTGIPEDLAAALNDLESQPGPDS